MRINLDPFPPVPPALRISLRYVRGISWKAEGKVETLAKAKGAFRAVAGNPSLGSPARPLPD